MKLEACNPYIRAAQTQPAIMEGTQPRKAYDYRLFYILENRGTIIIEGRSYDIRPDTLIIIPPAVAYHFRGKLKVCVLNFDVTRRCSHRTQPICPPITAAFDPALLFDTETVDEFDRPCILEGSIAIQESILKIISKFNTCGQYADASVSAMLKLLLADLLSKDTAPENKLSESVMSYIRIHAPSIACNEAVAKAFGYHPVYLNELIRRTTGKTLHVAIVDARLQLACRWLSGTAGSIADIAEAAGFCSRTHFCTVFKNKLGVTPSAYRKRPLQHHAGLAE